MKIEIIPCLQDNYSYLIIDKKNNTACVVDPSEADPGTIRADFAESLAKNAVHGSDSDENANIEANFHFSAEERF